MEQRTVTDNKEQSQFEIALEDGEVALMVYEMSHGRMALTHTEVPEAYEGQGVAGALAKHALDAAKTRGLKVLPYCPYVAAYIKKHPEYEELTQSA